MLRHLLVLAGVAPLATFPSPHRQRIWQPPSAHAALVRVVEAVQALDTDTVRTEIHGVTSVYRPPAEHRREAVQVRLDVAVVAPEAAAAEAHLAALRTRLAHQPWIGAEGSREEAVSYDRMRQACYQHPWVPGPGWSRPEGAAVREGTLAVDVDPRGFDPEFVEGEGEGESAGWGHYIRQTAQEDHVDLGRINVGTRSTVSIAGMHDDVHRIRPADREQRFTRTHVGNFLFRLEEADPRVQVTAIELEHAGEDTWRFTAEVTVRRLVP